MNENHDPKTGEFSSGGGGGSSHLPPHMQALMQKAKEYDTNKAKFGIIDRTPAGFGPGPSEAHATMDKNTAAAHEHTKVTHITRREAVRRLVARSRAQRAEGI